MRTRFLIICLLFVSSAIEAQNADIRLLRFLNSSETLPSDDVFRFISNSDVFVVAGVPVAMAVAGWKVHDKKLKRNAYVVAAGSLATAAVTNILKYSVNRDRPFTTYPDITKKGKAVSPSFPSGHTSSAFATATSLSLAYPKWYVIAPSFVYAGTVGYSRMDLGVHYPSDVLAGALIGSGCAWLTWKVNQKLLIKKKHKACDCPD
jgi:membrane-associated phospholipid phosphatase